jgi:hypothetical protein
LAAGYRLTEIRKLRFDEIGLICESYNYSLQPAWEQARYIAYVTAQVNSKKKLKPTDILKFTWDVDQPVTTTNKDVQRMINAWGQAINSN